MIIIIKVFHMQRIPESRCVRKETVDIGILVISRNGDRKIVQSIRITSRPSLRMGKWSTRTDMATAVWYVEIQSNLKREKLH